MTTHDDFHKTRSGCIADLKSKAWHLQEGLAQIRNPENFQNHFLKTKSWKPDDEPHVPG